MGEEKARDFPEAAHAHDAERQRRALREKGEQAGERGGRLGERGDFANVGPGGVRAANRLPEPRGGRHGLEMVIGNDDAHAAGAGGGDGGGERLYRAQLHVDERGEREKTREQLAALRGAEAVRAALRGMADGDEQRHTHARQGAEQRGGIGREGIGADFEEIQLAGADAERTAERAGRVNSADNLRSDAQISRIFYPAHILCSAQTIPMLGRKQELNLQTLQLADGFLLVVAFWVAHTLRFFGADWFGGWMRDKPIGPFSDFQWLLLAIVPFGPIFLELQGFYTNPLQKDAGRSLAQIARTFFWLGLLIAASAYFFKLDVPSRAVMPLFIVISTAALLLRERLTLARFRARAKREDLRESVVLVGTPEDTHQLRHTFTAEQLMETNVVAEIDIEQQPVSELIDALHKYSVNRVIFAGGHSHLNRLQEGIAACEIEGVEAWLVADFIRTAIARPSFDVFGTRPMLVFRTTPDVSWNLLIKSLTDRIGALLGLALLSWVFVLAALGIRLTSPGPVIFRQKRAGKNGKPFTMYKFRSMQTDAEMRQAELVAFNQMEGPVFKIDKDPRITPFGKFLRRTSIDEFPQLLNVLKGDMSLVGPRPLPIYEVEKFESTAQRRRLSMKPGLTCLWQISGRNQIKNFDEWVSLDLRYIDNWSLLLDAKILCKTVPVVLFGLGAK